ncbi:putative arabinan-endo 1,5-alpha-L-arabinase [Aspergillus ambiguus]|uniref:glycoside hydrolase family 43 protein n=1 Tax=Aspergillus ambiguus TaxID=176160 RepID=UPI003CCD54AE
MSSTVKTYVFVISIALYLLLGPATAAEPWNVLDIDFPDPAVISTDDGYYAFATSNGTINAQVAHSSDFNSWVLLDGVDALPGPFPDWVDEKEHPDIWAPDVIQLNDGTFVMYFSATARDDPSKHCVGAATSQSVKGPYKPEANVISCPLEQGGAIDASAFLDDDGTRYIVYKVDGNSLNTGDDMHPTPIMLQRMEADAVTPTGDPIQLIDRGNADGPLVEAPSLVHRDGVYYLSFSSNMFNTMYYDMSWATASSITGPWTKSTDPGAPLLSSGDMSTAGPLGGPGGADFREDGAAILFHAFNNGKDTQDGRGTWAANIKLADGKITLA